MAAVATAQESKEVYKRKQCCLCGRNRAYMTKFENWSEKEKQNVLRYVSKPPPRNSVVCKKDKLKAIRYCHTPDHVTKWNRTPNTRVPAQVVHTCMYPQCKATSEQDKIIQTSAPRDVLKQYLQLPTITEGPCGMCRKHYHQFYSHIHQPSVCSSYGARPKTDTRLTQHTPDAHK